LDEQKLKWTKKLRQTITSYEQKDLDDKRH